MRKTIAVFGSAVAEKSGPEYVTAVEIGRIIGEAGYDLLCGGYGGIMEAVCKGCREAGGRCRGIGLDHFKDPPNPYIDMFVKAATLGERLDYFIVNADLFLALPGGIGTVAEVMFVWDLAKSCQTEKTPVLLYGGGWKRFLNALREDFIIDPEFFRHILAVGSPDELPILLRGRRT